MIELESYTVSGFKSLAAITAVPVRGPTIITGANDSGKSTALRALEFLLGGAVPELGDHTLAAADTTDGEAVRNDRIEVTGVFVLEGTDLEEFDFGTRLTLRRISVSGQASYEVLRRVPTDSKLRSPEALGLQALRELASKYGVEPVGRGNAKASFIKPLQDYAAGLSHEDAWIPAASQLVGRLPRVMLFSSTAEPDPEGQIRSALKAAFVNLLNEPELVGPVRAAEAKVQEQLAEQANDLCIHIADRCPELGSIAVVPEVTFTEGFRSVRVLAARDGGVELP